MANLIIKGIIRFQFLVSDKDRTSRQIREQLEEYLSVVEGLSADRKATPVKVPAMRGVDEDMRNWSVNGILEHNAIVNRTFIAIVRGLVTGEEESWLSGFNPKTDVMPKSDPYQDQAQEFRKSVEDYLSFVKTVGSLRGTKMRQHPIFGMLDAHGWHGMFNLHLNLHLPQIKAVTSSLQSSN